MEKFIKMFLTLLGIGLSLTFGIWSVINWAYTKDGINLGIAIIQFTIFGHFLKLLIQETIIDMIKKAKIKSIQVDVEE